MHILVGGELRKLVETYKDPDIRSKPSLRWRDHQATVTVEIMENSVGKYAGIEICPTLAYCRSTWICVPAAVKGSRWRKFTYTLGERTEVRSAMRSKNGHELVVASEKLVVEGKRFAEAVRRGGRLEEEDSGTRGNQNQTREEKTVVIKILVGNYGLNWEALPQAETGEGLGR